MTISSEDSDSKATPSARTLSLYGDSLKAVYLADEIELESKTVRVVMKQDAIDVE
jgi:hypothetical protein